LWTPGAWGRIRECVEAARGPMSVRAKASCVARADRDPRTASPVRPDNPTARLSRAKTEPMGEKFWYLKHCDLCSRLSLEELRSLEARCLLRTFERKSLIYVPSDLSDSLLLLISGRVKLYHLTSEGKEAVLALIEPGELFGELSLVEPGRREEFAEAMLPSRVVLIPGAAFRELMERHPQVSLEVTRLMGLRRQRIERRLKSLLFRSNRERLIFLLLELAEKYGRFTEQGIQLGIRLSHQEMASMIGSTRETVTVLLGELQACGAILVRRRQITLKDLASLANEVDLSPSELPLPRPPSSAPQADRSP